MALSHLALDPTLIQKLRSQNLHSYKDVLGLQIHGLMERLDVPFEQADALLQSVAGKATPSCITVGTAFACPRLPCAK